MIQVAILKAFGMAIHFFQAGQIPAQLAALQQDKVFTKILTKYQDYLNVFFLNLIRELSKNTNINKHTIKLE